MKYSTISVEETSVDPVVMTKTRYAAQMPPVISIIMRRKFGMKMMNTNSMTVSATSQRPEKSFISIRYVKINGKVNVSQRYQ